MATLSVTLPGNLPVPTTHAPVRFAVTRKVTIQADNGARFTMPFAPVEMTMDNFTPAWIEVKRSGRKPILAVEQINLVTASFTLTIANFDKNHQQTSVEGIIAALRSIAASRSRLRIAYGALVSSYVWRMTALTINVKQRQPATNFVTQAEADITLKEASDYQQLVGPVTGGAQTVIPKRTGPTGSYTVRTGDTLFGIAQFTLGNGVRWPEIAHVNGIRDGRLGVPPFTVGRVLKIPPR